MLVKVYNAEIVVSFGFRGAARVKGKMFPIEYFYEQNLRSSNSSPGSRLGPAVRSKTSRGTS